MEITPSNPNGMAFGIKRDGPDYVLLAIAEIGEGLEYDGNHDIIESIRPIIANLPIMKFHAGYSENEVSFEGEITDQMIQEVKNAMISHGYTEEEIEYI